MKNTTAIYAMCAVLTCSCAWGQAANPAFANPATPAIETGQPQRDTVNSADQVFLRTAAIGNRAEVNVGELAADKASADAVKAFGRRMVTDHERAFNSVQELARASDTPLPREPDLDHRVVMQQLQEIEDDAFDIEYMRAQIADHQRTALLLQYQIGAGQSDQVRNFAKETLVHVMEHLAMARSIHADLTGAAP